MLEEQEAKINFLFDRPLALLCFCSQGHHQSSAINPSPNDILPLNQAFSASLSLQLSILAHSVRTTSQARSVTLMTAKKLLNREIPFLVHLPQLVMCLLCIHWQVSCRVQDKENSFYELPHTAFRKPPASSVIFLYSYCARSELLAVPSCHQS